MPCLMFKYLSHFEFIFMFGERVYSSFIDLHVTVQLFCFLQWLSSEESTSSEGDAGDMGLIPELGRSSVGMHGNPLQYFCLENPMGRGAGQATVHRVIQNHTVPK